MKEKANKKIIGKKIISKKNIGGKAFNLLQLEKKLKVPSFFIISSSVFKAHIEGNKYLKKIFKKNKILKSELKEIRRNIQNININKEVLSSINKELAKLNTKKFIARSSFTLEDSSKKSYAGLFSSFIFKENIENVIKKIWISGFSEELYVYTKGLVNMFEIAIIVQEFIDSDYSGVIFFQKNMIPELLLEYSNKGYNSVVNGDVNPELAFKLINNPELVDYYFNSENQIKNLIWLDKISKNLDEIFVRNKEGKDLEFCVKDDEIYYLQVRGLTKRFDIVGSSFIFAGMNRWGYHLDDFVLKKIKTIFKEININNYPVFFVEKNIPRIEIKSFFLFIEEINRKMKNREFIKNFVSYFSAVKIKQYNNSENISDFYTAIRDFKKNRFEMSVLDFVHGLIKSAQLSYIKKTYGMSEKKELVPLIAPPVSYGVERLILKKDYFLRDENMGIFKEELMLFKNKNLTKIKEKINKNHKNIISLFLKMDRRKRNFFILVKEIIWLRDCVDFYHDRAEINYSKYILNFFKDNKIKYTKNSSINSVGKLSFKEIDKILINKKIEFKSKKKKIVKVTEKNNYSFPLSGVTVSPGQFTGIVKIVRDNDDLDNISSQNILVAKHTRPSLVVGMAISKGIITESGGITSHASIISRELGKPCLVSVYRCTKILKDGDKIRVKNGKIYKLSS